MTLAYRIELTPDDNETFLVTCPMLPEVTTFGEDADDAVVHAANAIWVALAGRMADGADIPLSDLTPDAARRDDVVRVPVLASLKVHLYQASRSAGVTRAELSRRLGWHREQVDRLFRLDHASRLDQLEAAFRALGQELDFAVRDAA